MQKHNRTKVVFKDYSPNQILLLPPSLEDLIDPNHPVRFVNQVIDSLDIDPILKKYRGGGCSSYHPRLLLKLLVYGYLSNQYSSRKIEQAAKQNIYFMWLSAMSYPDHNTINRFRSDSYTCPMGNKLDYLKEKTKITENGFKQIKRIYQAHNCTGCPMREACHKSIGNRTIEVNQKLNHYKSIIKERLTSERGIKYRSQRPVDVEAVFGIIKGIDIIGNFCSEVSIRLKLKQVFWLWHTTWAKLPQEIRVKPGFIFAIPKKSQKNPVFEKH